MENPFENMLKMMNLPLDSSAKYYEVLEKGKKAMESMAIAQKDMAEFQEAWKEFESLNPFKK
jgi:hypothetical protein